MNRKSLLYVLSMAGASVCLAAFASRAIAEEGGDALEASAPAPTLAAGLGDTLAGRLPKTLTAEASPYVVVADLVVPQGKTVIVEPGVVFLFRNFTGVKVQGALLIRGTSENPVVFSSVNDRRYNPDAAVDPAPYDWNGVYIYEDGAGSNLKYCTVEYSVYGVISLTKFVRIGPAVFRHNGRANVTIEGIEQEVGDEPFEYALTAGEVRAEGVPLTILRDPNAVKRNVSRYGGVSLFAGGATLAAVFTARFIDSRDRVRALSSTEPANLADHTADEWQTARDEAVGRRAAMFAGYALGVIGAVGFTYSFTF